MASQQSNCELGAEFFEWSRLASPATNTAMARSDSDLDFDNRPCRILGPMPGSHETALGDSRLRQGCLGNRAAGLRYRVAGSDAPGTRGLPQMRYSLPLHTSYVVSVPMA